MTHRKASVTFLQPSAIVLALLLSGSVFGAEKANDRKPAQSVEVYDTPEAAAKAAGWTTDNKQQPAAAAQPTEKPADPAPATESNHKRWLFSAVLSPFDQWIAGKYGFMITYMPDPNTAYEFEYLRGSYGFDLLGEELGTAVEQRASIFTRYFLTESFNYHAGINYDHLDVTLKDNFTNTVTTSSGEDYTYVELATLGVTIGVGNRWRTDSGIEIGVDWLQLQMPMIRLKQYSPFIDLSGDVEKSDAVRDAVLNVRDKPRFAALKFQAGISF